MHIRSTAKEGTLKHLVRSAFEACTVALGTGSSKPVHLPPAATGFYRRPRQKSWAKCKEQAERQLRRRTELNML